MMEIIDVALFSFTPAFEQLTTRPTAELRKEAVVPVDLLAARTNYLSTILELCEMLFKPARAAARNQM